MNKIIVLFQVSVVFIACIGVSNAAPPFLEPVEVVTGNDPLQVTVTNEPTVKIPFVGNSTCIISGFNAAKVCSSEIPRLSTFPEGTNTAVLEQISIDQIADDDESDFQIFEFQLATNFNGQTYRHYAPIEPGILTFDVYRRTYSANITTYHDGNGGAVWYEFRQTNPNIQGNTHVQRFSYAGYYTWVKPLTP